MEVIICKCGEEMRCIGYRYKMPDWEKWGEGIYEVVRTIWKYRCSFCNHEVERE